MLRFCVVSFRSSNANFESRIFGVRDYYIYVTQAIITHGG